MKNSHKQFIIPPLSKTKPLESPKYEADYRKGTNIETTEAFTSELINIIKQAEREHSTWCEIIIKTKDGKKQLVCSMKWCIEEVE